MLGYLEERFGIPAAVFADYLLLRRGSSIWILSRDERLADLAPLKVDAVGLLFLRRVGTHLKPTTTALQLFGAQARRNVVHLEPVQLRQLYEEGEITGDFQVSPGYVVIKEGELIIGCALYVPGRLLSRFPRHLFAPQTWDFLLEEDGS